MHMYRTRKINLAEPDRIRIQTPVGEMIIEERGGAVTALYAAGETDAAVPGHAAQSSVLTIAAREIAEYFNGTRTSFSFAMRPEGTPFQQKVWQALLRIPYGETRTYGEIALEAGNPGAARAVGGACNKNPIWIAVPCHRVLGSNGSLTGYAYGTGMKQRLLTLEKDHKPEI